MASLVGNWDAWLLSGNLQDPWAGNGSLCFSLGQVISDHLGQKSTDTHDIAASGSVVVLTPALQPTLANGDPEHHLDLHSVGF